MPIRTCFIGTQSPHRKDVSIRPRSRKRELLGAFVIALTLGSQLIAPQKSTAQVNGVGHRPYLGWSSFSEQTLNSSFLTQANISAESDALASSGLQPHGFKYINIDSGWQGSFDG